MKTTLLLTIPAVIFFASCSTGNKMQSSVNSDDLYTVKTESSAGATDDYYSDAPASAYEDGQVNPDPDYTTTEKYTDENGTSYITNNYYEGQNYDFYGSESSYSADLNHWYGPSLGFSYFSPYYSMPGFGVSWSIGFGWGSSWYNPYYYPYYSWYYPYSYCGYPYYYPYWNGYYGGGYCGGGYYGGYGDGYYYGGNTYYGPRGSSSSNTSSDGGGRSYSSAGEEGGLNGDGGRMAGSSGLNVAAPASQNTVNAKSGVAAPVITTGSGVTRDIKRNPVIEDGNLSETGNVKGVTGKNPNLNGQSNDIKSVVPPAHSVTPANNPARQNTQDGRPRTSSSAELLFQQQRASNAAINASNNHQQTGNTGIAASQGIQDVTKGPQSSSSVKANITGNAQFSKSPTVQKINGLENQKGNVVASGRSSKSGQQIKMNANSERHSISNGNSTSRSYSQLHSNSNNFSSGSSRNSSGSFHRK